MGRPKALLTAAGRTFVECAVETLLEGGCDRALVVLNDADARVVELVERTGGRIVRGEGEDSEQIESLRAALRAVPTTAEAAVVVPVDHPLVAATTVAALIDAYRTRGAPIVRAVFRGRHGHPVLFGSAMFAELLSGSPPPAEGARTIVRRHESEIEEVEVSDPGIAIDIDTPSDYREQVGEG